MVFTQVWVNCTDLGALKQRGHKRQIEVRVPKKKAGEVGDSSLGLVELENPGYSRKFLK